MLRARVILTGRELLIAFLGEVAIQNVLVRFIPRQLALREDPLLIRIILVILHLRVVDDLVYHAVLLSLVSIKCALLRQVLVQAGINVSGHGLLIHICSGLGGSELVTALGCRARALARIRVQT